VVLNSRYSLYLHALTLGLLSALLLYSTYYLVGRGTYWGITTGESKLGGHLWILLVDPGIRDTLYYKQFKLVNPLTDHTQVIVIAILLGGRDWSSISWRVWFKTLPKPLDAPTGRPRRLPTRL
jgi:hypothetical protein